MREWGTTSLGLCCFPDVEDEGDVVGTTERTEVGSTVVSMSSTSGAQERPFNEQTKWFNKEESIEIAQRQVNDLIKKVFCKCF